MINSECHGRCKSNYHIINFILKIFSKLSWLLADCMSPMVSMPHAIYSNECHWRWHYYLTSGRLSVTMGVITTLRPVVCQSPQVSLLHYLIYVWLIHWCVFNVHAYSENMFTNIRATSDCHGKDAEFGRSCISMLGVSILTLYVS